jgi:hypothetical protein
VATAKQYPRRPTDELVKDVLDNGPGHVRAANNWLYSAIRNTKGTTRDVYDEIRSCWGRGKKGIRKPVHKVAYQLAAWACGVSSAKAVQHMCDFVKAVDSGGAKDV